MFKKLKPAAGIAIVTTMMLSAFPAFAASDSIASIRVSVNETKMEAGTVWEAEPTVSSKDYEITDYEWSSDYDNWEPGKKVTLKVSLESDEKTFSKDAKVSVTNGEAASSSRKSTKKYQVNINYTPRVILQAPEGIQYDDEYTLVWDKVDYAGGYEVKLYKDGSSYKTVSVSGKSNTEIDLSDYATDDYLITAAVRAVAPSGKTKYITASDWVMFDDESVSSSEDSTVYGAFSGSGSSKKFKDSDGNAATGWQEINGNWYFFDPDNKNNAVTDQWLTHGDYKYLFDADGKMQTGWVKDGDYWYYLSQDTTGEIQPYGSMMTGWVKTGPGSPWYFLNDGRTEDVPYGSMLVNRMTPDGYTVDENGAWQE
ncbi:MAG: hypothetical protein LUE86_11425 [Clostridiales bacterium]|nr:hypothetical protein [Clostridiales bacterium]